MATSLSASAIDHRGISDETLSHNRLTLIENGQPTPVLFDANDDKGVLLAVDNLCADFGRVSGTKAQKVVSANSNRMIIVGTLQSSVIKPLLKKGVINEKELKGKTEKYIIKTVQSVLPGVDEALVITGSDKRGTIYGIYELSEQIGVSPWYDWADVPVVRHSNLSVAKGTYTAGEPAVRYRGIFLNDEAPCLTSWVENTYGTNYGGHKFYARVFELLLRLRANFMWPAMWGWSFYADDAENSKTANEMGIIMGTSHHEPMARNHQEWARKRDEYGAWDYTTNKPVLDKFFTEGMERAKNTEDLITIGMRGDGDAPIGGKEGHDDKYAAHDEQVKLLLENVIDNQRKIIATVTGQKAEKRPQVWALYKEVQRYYELGLKVPDDVTILLSDDNWGNVRKLPNAQERKRKGGWGMYYHVDYVGAPRNSKWLNVTPIQNLWEQMQLTYDYGADKLWVLNVGDLKPMEYPITLFLDMAWNPKSLNADNLLDHTRHFCAQQFGDAEAADAARILNLYSKYAGRVTAEMLTKDTYDLPSGEWQQVVGQWVQLEAEALRQYLRLPASCRDAYQELILFPVQAMTNVYQMYFAQAMNHDLAARGMAEANLWADKTEQAFARDAELCRAYNEDMAGGKWRGMMTQKHIGYTSWHDNFPKDICPAVVRLAIDPDAHQGDHVFEASGDMVVIEAPHYYESLAAAGTKWTKINHMGRTLGAMALMPYTEAIHGAALRYKVKGTTGWKKARVHVVTKSTLPFLGNGGHRFSVAFEGGEEQTVTFNDKLLDTPEYAYTVFYPTVATRVVDTVVELPLPHSANGTQLLTIKPLDPGIVFEKIIIDNGGYTPQYLLGKESWVSREK